MKKFNNLVAQLSLIPCIGKKSALKIAHTLALENKPLALNIAHCIEEAVGCVQKCELCGGLSEGAICEICGDERRLFSGQMCVVGSARDILSIEESGAFGGVYLVAEEPKALDFEAILRHIQTHRIREVIFAFSPSIASDAMMLFIEDRLLGADVRFSKIAQGVPTGVGLDNVDKLSLSRALEDRVGI